MIIYDNLSSAKPLGSSTNCKTLTLEHMSQSLTVVVSERKQTTAIGSVRMAAMTDLKLKEEKKKREFGRFVICQSG